MRLHLKQQTKFATLPFSFLKQGGGHPRPTAQVNLLCRARWLASSRGGGADLCHWAPCVWLVTHYRRPKILRSREVCTCLFCPFASMPLIWRTARQLTSWGAASAMAVGEPPCTSRIKRTVFVFFVVLSLRFSSLKSGVCTLRPSFYLVHDELVVRQRRRLA